MIDQQFYSTFLNIGMDFVSDFADSADHRRVADIILKLLTENLDLNMDHQDHPFNKYGEPLMSRDEVCDQLKIDTLYRLAEDTQFTRSLVRAFCSPHGVYRESLNDLLDKYQEFINQCV